MRAIVHPLRIVCCLFGLAICLNASNARGEVSFSYGSSQAVYSAAAGTAVSVPIYLDETIPPGSTDFITPNGGLDGAGAAVNFYSVVGGSAATFGANSFTPVSPFFAPSSAAYYYNSTSGQDALEFALLTPAEDYAFPTNNQVEIGTLSITVGTGATSFAITSINDDTIAGGSGGQGDGYTATVDGPYDLDAVGEPGYVGADAAPPTIITIEPSAVPEPASMSALGLLAVAALRRNRRQHRHDRGGARTR